MTRSPITVWKGVLLTEECDQNPTNAFAPRLDQRFCYLHLVELVYLFKVNPIESGESNLMTFPAGRKNR